MGHLPFPACCGCVFQPTWQGEAGDLGDTYTTGHATHALLFWCLYAVHGKIHASDIAKTDWNILQWDASLFLLALTFPVDESHFQSSVKYDMSVWGKHKQMPIAEDPTCSNFMVFSWVRRDMIFGEISSCTFVLSACKQECPSCWGTAPLLSHAAAQWEAMGYIATSVQLSPPNHVFWRRHPSDQTEPPWIIVDPCVFPLNETDAASHREIKLLSGGLDKAKSIEQFGSSLSVKQCIL